MRTLSLTHLSDQKLLRRLARLLARERGITAEVLAYLAEVDARKLYLRMGHPSMFEFCVRKLGLSDDSALKRIQAARAASANPSIFTAVGDGRLHLSAVCLLAPHMRPENAADLISAASHKTKSEIATLLAQRYPRTELLPMVDPVPTSRSSMQVVPEQVDPRASKLTGRQHAPAHADPLQHAPGQVAASAQRATVAPLSAQSFALHMTIGSETHEKLLHAQSLLSHQIPSGDLAQVLDRVLDLAIGQLEKRKFAATSKPRKHSRRPTTSRRHIPAHVKRAVWERDQGRCTFTSETGRRCGAHKFLEFDHIDPVARDGQATVQNIRLRCHAHNQHEAECAFGTSFMQAKREAARYAAAARVDNAAQAAEQARRAAEEARAAAEARAASDRDVLAALRTLRFRADESRRAMEFSSSLADAPLEERVRLALSYFRPKVRPHASATANIASPM